AGVGNTVGERGDGFAAAGPQMLFVVDEQGCAVLFGEFGDIATADRERSVGTDLGGVGEQVAGQRAHSCSGAVTPRRSRPMARPMRAASTSHRRARPRSASMPSPMT